MSAILWQLDDTTDVNLFKAEKTLRCSPLRSCLHFLAVSSLLNEDSDLLDLLCSLYISRANIAENKTEANPPAAKVAVQMSELQVAEITTCMMLTSDHIIC